MSLLYISLAAVLFAISVFPVHLCNYVYINTAQKYASLNVGVYGFNVYNMNTVKDHPNEMQINGKNKKIQPDKIKLSYYKIFNQICLYKIIQLGDYGMQNQNNAYVALAQNCFTTAIYKFIQMNGNFCKLRNYAVLNEEHADVLYYSKAVTIINLIVILKVILVIIGDKLHELKN